MRRFPLHAGLACAAVALVWPLSEGRAAEQTENALSVFADLGLPDVHGAKWVWADMLSASGAGGELPAPEGQRVNGNAWLLREEPAGMVTLVLRQARLIHARRAKLDEVTDEVLASPEPLVQIAPADLTADLKVLQQGFEAFTKLSSSSDSAEDYQAAQRIAAVGESLLLLAHLQQQGRAEAGPLLAQALQAAPAEPSLDAAISLLADGKLIEFNERWAAGAGPEAYASGIEALASQFHRGWKNRGAALLLAQRVRQEGGAEPPGEAGKLLASLRIGAEAELPLETNWLLPASDANDGSTPFPRRRFAPAGAGKPVPEGARAAAFFQKRTEAAKALVSLLESHRPLRILKPTEHSDIFAPGADDATPTGRDTLRRYADLPRPYELGELAAALLLPILPDELRSSVQFAEGEEKNGPLVAWIASLEGKSDEELAWTYLTGAEGPDSRSFGAALSFLVAHGSPASQSRLQQVFLDPAVWAQGMPPEVVGALKAFVARLGPEAADFGARLLAVVKAPPPRDADGPNGPDLNEEMRKELAAQRAGQIRELEQVLHPRDLATLLDDYIAADPAEAASLLQPLRLQVHEERDRGKTEALLLQAAAKVSRSADRFQILSILSEPDPPGKAARHAPAPPLDPPTLAALARLLSDASAPSEEGFDGMVVSTAEMAGWAVLRPRLEPEAERRLERLESGARWVGRQWIFAAGNALVKGEPLPPLPGSATLPSEQIAELAESWRGQTGAQVLTALHALPLEKQAALIAGLASHSPWEAPLTEAQLTVAELYAADPALLPAATAWKGRLFDETLRKEVSAALRERALAGTGVYVSFTAPHPLSGLTINVVKRNEHYTRSIVAQFKLAGLESHPPFEAIVGCYTQLSAPGQSGARALMVQPVWKDPAVTESWEKEQPNTAKDSTSGPGERNDPAAVEAVFTALRRGDAASIAAFQIVYYAVPIHPDETR